MKSLKTKLLLLGLLLTLLGGSFSTAYTAGKTNMEIFYYKQEISAEMQEMADLFSKRNPNVNVKLTIIPNDSMTILRTRMAGGDAPDVIQLQAYSAVFEFARAGWLADLTNEPVLAKVVEGAKNSVTYNGKIYALPMDLAGIGIIYNKEIFKKYNLKPPTTFSELQKVCSTLRKNKVTPFAALFRQNWSLGHFLAMVHTTLAGEKLLPWIEAMNAGKASWADPVDTKAIFRIMDFYQANVGDKAAEMDWPEQVAAFASGEAAMMVQGLWSYKAALDVNPKLNCGFVAFPCTDNVKETKLFADVDSTFAVASTITPERMKAAKAFLEWLSTPEAVKIWVEKCKLVPTFKGADVSSMSSPFQDLVRYMNQNQINPWGFAMYPIAAWENATKTAAQEYIFGMRTPDQVVQLIDDTWRQNIQ